MTFAIYIRVIDGLYRYFYTEPGLESPLNLVHLDENKLWPPFTCLVKKTATCRNVTIICQACLQQGIHKKSTWSTALMNE